MRSRRIGSAMLVMAIAVTMLAPVASWAKESKDGVVFLSEKTAKKGRATQGDAGGYPISLNEPGHYRLIEHLHVSDPDTTGILVTVPGVHIDLNGFTLSGPVVCDGSPTVTSCAPGGAGEGITADGIKGFSVYNGTVMGFANGGIVAINGDGDIRAVNANNNGRSGIVATSGRVHNCSSNRNGGTGIEGPDIVSDSRTDGNKGAGVASATTRIENLVTTRNGGSGVFMQQSGIVTGVVARFNEGFGFETAGGGGAIGYKDNTFIDNTMGTVSGGTPIGTNLCDGSTTCP